MHALKRREVAGERGQICTHHGSMVVNLPHQILAAAQPALSVATLSGDRGRASRGPAQIPHPLDRKTTQQVINASS